MDITLLIDSSKLPTTTKVKNTMSEEEKEQVRAKNEEIRKEREAYAQQISTKFAQFKRDFMGAPIRLAMKCSLAGKSLPPLEIPYRPTENFWVQTSEKDVTVTFPVHFDNDDDKAFARIFLLEF